MAAFFLLCSVMPLRCCVLLCSKLCQHIPPRPRWEGGDSTDSMNLGAAWPATHRRDTQLIAAIQSRLQSVAPSRQIPTTVSALPQTPGLAQANFVWGLGKVIPEQFIQSVRVAYSECVHWRRNIFSVPSGRVGKAVVSELARLVQPFKVSL